MRCIICFKKTEDNIFRQCISFSYMPKSLAKMKFKEEKISKIRIIDFGVCSDCAIEAKKKWQNVIDLVEECNNEN